MPPTLNNERIKQSDGHTFILIEGVDNNDYSRDKNHPFYLGEIIVDANPTTYHVHESYRTYVMDDQNVFHKG